MSPLVIAAISFGCIVAGAAVGMMVGARLPGHHLASESKDVVRLAMAMIATMTALVLGLVTASAKNAFDSEDAAIKQASADLLALDRMLADYGPQTHEIRGSIKQLLAAKLAEMWPQEGGSKEVAPSSSHPSEAILGQILALAPQTDAQQWFKARALDLSGQILQARWIVFSGTEATAPTLFLIVIICWLAVLFGSFGLFAPRNATVIAALLLCSLSVAASVFLILDMNRPFSGVMKISSAPIQYAVSRMGQ